MTKQKETWTVAAMADRQKFYRDKALKLEQEIIFAKEEVAQLKEEMTRMQAERLSGENSRQETEQELKKQKEAYDALAEKYRGTRHNLEQLSARVSALEKNQRRPSDLSEETYRHRVKGYEQLLADVQKELNDRGKRIEVYERRIANLEQRLQLEKKRGKHVETGNLSATPTLPERRATAVMDYTWIHDGQRSIIHGHVRIENTGAAPLDAPVLCFRFDPGDAAILKGHVYQGGERGSEEKEAGAIRWAIVEGDSEETETGEIWVRPVNPLLIEPGQSVTFSEFQIPIDHNYIERMGVQCFVFFGEDTYKIRCANRILINVSPDGFSGR